MVHSGTEPDHFSRSTRTFIKKGIMKRRTEITIETDRLVVLGRARSHARVGAWCSRCASHVHMMTTDDAAISIGVNSRTIFHWAESGRLHSMESPEGLLLICPNSLTAK